MDLLLSHYLQQKYKISVKPSQSSQWMVQVRGAKEKLLREDNTTKADITVLSRGSSLLRKARKFEVTKTEVSEILIEGFVPSISLTKPKKKNKSGLRRIGLPYEIDTAITQHLANFLIDNQDIMKKSLAIENAPKHVIPEVVLFNGGVFYSDEIKNRVVNTIGNWKSGEIDALVNTSPSLAVAKGAVYYAQAKSGKGVQIKSSAPTSYFLKLDDDIFICILPIGSVEDQVYKIEQKFKMLVGQAALFELFTSKQIQAKQGEIVQASDLVKLSETILKIDANKDLEVRLNVSYSSIGLLLIEAIDSNHNIYPLSFSIKQKSASLSSNKGVAIKRNIDQKQLKNVLDDFFRGKDVIPLKDQLEKAIGIGQPDWPVFVLRSLSDMLLPYYSQARHSGSQEKHWWNILGYCLRPGNGDKLDSHRIDTLWKRYAHGVQCQHQQNISEFWVCWRRISSGLSVLMQEKIFNDIKAIIYTRKDQLNKKQLLGYVEKMRLIASLEKLSIGKRVDIGNYLVRQILKKGEDHLLWWMLGRVANRALFTNGADVISPDQVEIWLDKLIVLDLDKKFQSNAAKSYALMIQKTKDPLVDISVEKFNQMLTKLTSWRVSKNTLAFAKGGKLDNDEMNLYAIGEALPLGLVLLDT
jgi:hypothetical protein